MTDVKEAAEKWFNKHYYTIDPIARNTALVAFGAGYAEARSDESEIRQAAAQATLQELCDRLRGEEFPSTRHDEPEPCVTMVDIQEACKSLANEGILDRFVAKAVREMRTECYKIVVAFMCRSDVWKPQEL